MPASYTLTPHETQQMLKLPVRMNSINLGDGAFHSNASVGALTRDNTAAHAGFGGMHI